MKNTITKQTVTFLAKPEEVYNLLIDSKLHAKFTGDNAKIGKKVGDKFTAYGDYISGVNLELVPGKKIVQQWKASDWEEGVESKVSFIFTPTKTGTKLFFTQSGVPQDQVKSIKQGWVDFYWEPMKEYLKNE